MIERKRVGRVGLLCLILAVGMVQACDSGTGAVIERPGAPALSEPADGSEQVNALAFRWSSDPAATHYHVQLTRDASFDDVGIDARVVESTFMELSQLEIGATYHWRVRAVNDAFDGPWTSTWSFTVVGQAPLPGPTKLLWPPDEANQMPTDVTLEWEAAELARRYHVQVSQEPVFLRLDADLTNVAHESQQIFNLDSTYVYFWRVRSRNLAGYGPWSDTRSFIVLANEGWVPGT